MERSLIEILTEAERLDEAESALRDGIAYREKYHSPEHPHTLEMKAKLLAFLANHSRLEDTMNLFAACEKLASLNTASPERHQLAITTLVDAYDALGESQNANFWRSKSELNVPVEQ